VKVQPEDRQRIISLYKDGMTRPAIARETGWSVGTVDRTIKNAEVTGAGRVTGTRMPPEDEAEIVALYGQGIPWAQIMARTGHSESAIAAAIKRSGVTPDRRDRYSTGDWERAADLYRQGASGTEIARSLRCHPSYVHRTLAQMGVDLRHPVACDRPDYFDQIDTSEKAYWLGFIATDGCVTGFSRNRPRIIVKLARKDREHLVLLRTTLGVNSRIRDEDQFSKGKIRPYSILEFSGRHMASALISHGITPRKTNILQPWDGPGSLLPHYWRGIVDGDGHITISGGGVFVGVTCSQGITEGFAAWVNANFGTRVNAKPAKGRSWAIQVGGTRRVLGLLAALYDDAPVALARKKALSDLAVHGKPLQAAF
jgi:transposase-like protein